MRIGGVGLLGAGLNLSDLLRTQATAEEPKTGIASFGRAKSCILLFLMGGPSQHSTWDPKPNAPAEVRGDFAPIATTVPGLSISELLPRTSLVANKLCILRAVSTGDNAHSSSGYYMLTGRPHQPMNFENANPGAPNDAPSMGAVLRRISKARGGLPPSVTLPHRIFNTDGSIWPGQDAGFLGRTSDPWLLTAKLTAGGIHRSRRSTYLTTLTRVAWGDGRAFSGESSGGSRPSISGCRPGRLMSRHVERSISSARLKPARHSGWRKSPW